MSEPVQTPRGIGRGLDARVEEEDIRRVWRNVEPQLVRAPRRTRRGAALTIGAALVVLGVAMTMANSRSEPSRFLALADGSAPTAIATSLASTLSFADGSRIELDAGTEVVPTRNDARELALRLVRGRARFVVTPGGPRRWRIDAGLATVEVIGTVFVIDRTTPDLHVSVERGHVRVRASASEARRWDLVAGSDVWVPAPERVEVAAASTSAPMDEDVTPTPASVRHPPTTSSHRSIAPADDAVDEEASDDGEMADASPRELMLLADVARLSGRPTDAIAPLAQLVAEHPQSAEAALAAVMLGRLQQDAAHDPASAARALETAEALGVPGSLADDVEGRLALAYLAIGDARGVERARRYLEAHPDGRHASALRARRD